MEISESLLNDFGISLVHIKSLYMEYFSSSLFIS